MTKIAGYGSGSEFRAESISKRHGSGDPDPDPHQNVMDPQHCLKVMHRWDHWFTDPPRLLSSECPRPSMAPLSVSSFSLWSGFSFTLMQDRIRIRLPYSIWMRSSKTSKLTISSFLTVLFFMPVLRNYRNYKRKEEPFSSVCLSNPPSNLHGKRQRK
jgi:hypothetical protein